MNHIKLYEEFSGNSQKTYIYYIKDKNEFHADVRDPDGKIIFELKPSDISNDGYMKTKDDISGLVKLLISKNKIKTGDIVVPADEVRNEDSSLMPTINKKK